MSKFKNITEGWTNYLNFFYRKDHVTPEIKELAKSRANICKDCPSLTASKMWTLVETVLPSGDVIEQLTDDKLAGEKIQGYKCGECGCGFPAKVFAKNEKCPLNKW
tara:strand:- start:314 stop:631 length:318 start_codon:yes stop_codon:yes gene_type:complete